MKKKTEEQQQVLQVLLYRKDEVDPIVIAESTSFSECKKVWKDLIDRWTKAHKEAEPFVLERPIVTAFEPGMVGEIKIFPKMEPQINVDPNNPYQQQMMNRGLTHTMKNHSNIYDTGAGGGYAFGDLMDGGYK